MAKIGGEGGDRTHGPVARTAVFETARFGHSRTSPRGRPERRQENVWGRSIVATINCEAAYSGECNFSIDFLRCCSE